MVGWCVKRRKDVKDVVREAGLRREKGYIMCRSFSSRGCVGREQ